MNKQILTLIFILFAVSNLLFAQNSDSNSGKKGVVVHDIDLPQVKVKHKGVKVHSDDRLDGVIKKHIQVKQGVIHSGKGFRVQIYNGTDRNKATQIKIDFVHHYPGIRSYISYVSPQFKVKVGDFKDRKIAQKFYQQVNKIYSPCMVVNDVIEINTLHDN